MLQSNTDNHGNRHLNVTVNKDYHRSQPAPSIEEGSLARSQNEHTQETLREDSSFSKCGMFASVRSAFSSIRKCFSAIGRFLFREPQFLPVLPTPEEQELLDTIADIGFGEVSFIVVNKQIILSSIKVSVEYVFSKPYIPSPRTSRSFNREQRSLLQLLRSCPQFEVTLQVKALNGYPYMGRLTYDLSGNKAN